MSIDTVVVFSRARIVSPVQWQSQIESVEPGLLIDTDFDPLEFTGFLPCTLGREDCGFEYYVDDLDEDAREALGTHFDAEWDSILTLVTRGEVADSHSALIAAAAFALAVGGSVLGDDDVPLGRSNIKEWVQCKRDSLAITETEKRDAAARRESATAEGSDGVLFRTLSELSGRNGILQCQMGMLALSSKPDFRIFSGAWRIDIDGSELNSCRYAALREEQIALLSSERSSGQFQEIDERLDEAGSLDEIDIDKLSKLLPRLGELSIVSARYDRSGQVVFELKGEQAVTVRWYGLGTSSISLSAAGLQWTIDKEGASLL